MREWICYFQKNQPEPQNEVSHHRPAATMRNHNGATDDSGVSVASVAAIDGADLPDDVEEEMLILPCEETNTRLSNNSSQPPSASSGYGSTAPWRK